MSKTIYPIIYKIIPTQYSFLLEESGEGKYRVQVMSTRDLKETVFDSKKEAMEFINQKRVL